LRPSVPLATTWAVVESGNAAPQAPAPPPLTVVEAQVTVTADTGTVGQFAKAAADACTVRFHVLFRVPVYCHVTVAAELPGSLGDVDGLEAVNEIVPGVAVRVTAAGAVAAIGCGRVGSTRGVAVEASTRNKLNHSLMAIHWLVPALSAACWRVRVDAASKRAQKIRAHMTRWR